MQISKKRLIRRVIAAYLLASTTGTHAADTFYNGMGSSTDMSNTANWNPNDLPSYLGTYEIAKFLDPTIIDPINTNPTLASGFLLQPTQFSFTGATTRYNLYLTGGCSIEFLPTTAPGNFVGVQCTNAAGVDFYLNDASMIFRDTGSSNIPSGTLTEIVTYNIGQNGYISFLDNSKVDAFTQFILSDNGTLNYNAVPLTGNQKLEGVISGAGIVNLDMPSSSDTLYTNTPGSSFVGQFNIISGTLEDTGVPNSFPETADYVLSANGGITLNSDQQIGSLAGSGTVGLATTSATLTLDNANDTTFSGSLSLNLTKATTATGVFTVSGTNNFISFFDVEGGTVRCGSSDVFAPSTNFQIGSGILDINGYTVSIGNLTGSGLVNLGSGSNLALTTNSDSIFDGSILGGGNLAKLGANKQTFTGELDLSQLLINSGTVALSGANATLSTPP